MKRLAAMGAYRLSYYFKQNGEPKYHQKFPSILTADITAEELQVLESNYMESVRIEESNLQQLYKCIQPDDEAGHLAWVCLEFALLFYMEKQAGEVFAHIDAFAQDGVTMGMVAKVLYGNMQFLDKFSVIREAYQRIELLLLAEYPVRKMMDVVLRADDRLIDWLSGGEDVDLLQSRFVSLYQPLTHMQEQNFWEEQTKQLAESIMHFEHKIPVVVVSGDAQSGRHFIVKRVADICEMPVIFVDLIYLGNLQQILAKWRTVLRECYFSRRAICVTGLRANEELNAYIRILTEEYMQFAGPNERLPLFFITDKNVKVTPLIQEPVLNLALPIPSVRRRKEAWDYFISQTFGENRFQTAELAVKMKLPIGKIEKIVNRLYCAKEETVYDSATVFRYCYELLDDGRYDSIKRVESIYTIDDLKLEQAQKNVIRDICHQVEYRQKVLEDWNLKSKYAYGTSVSALFSGPPGTGKTMAVHVMAGMLGLELFKVDLSQIVDKYIGETEKKLEEVFNKAEQSNMILFFDEADSIIGKRSEVKDSKDKYANTEVSYLLQKIEEYDGIVILATNYSQNIDAAIMRRIRFTVHFPLPDEATRKEIWKSSIPQEVPQQNIDYDYLASQFEFSGGQIKNVVLNAVFFAAAEQKILQMQHLVKALKMELTKEKKISFQESLGAYAHLCF